MGTTGLADPAPVAQTFFIDPDVKALYKLDGILAVVDAKHCLEHLREEKPEGVENESVEQVAFADRILLNKTDLVAEEELLEVEGVLRSINATAGITRTQHGVIDPKLFLNLSSFSLARVMEMDPEFLSEGEHSHDMRVSTCSATFEGELNIGLLQQWIDELKLTKGKDLFRYKGILAVKGLDPKFVFQGVHMICSCALLPGQFWAPAEKRTCTFVFIGRDLDKEALINGFQKCKVTEELRFKVGDAVEARTKEGWVRGTILKTWQEGNPYRIELSNRMKVWGPVDSDAFVRSVAA